MNFSYLMICFRGQNIPILHSLDPKIYWSKFIFFFPPGGREKCPSNLSKVTWNNRSYSGLTEHLACISLNNGESKGSNKLGTVTGENLEPSRL
jgi:hypothetical protein